MAGKKHCDIIVSDVDKNLQLYLWVYHSKIGAQRVTLFKAICYSHNLS